MSNYFKIERLESDNNSSLGLLDIRLRAMSQKQNSYGAILTLFLGI